MKTKDYLHSQLISDKRNDRVFQKTYTTIHKFAKQMTDMQVAAFGLEDNKHISDMEKMNANYFSDEIIELVNYTIQNFNKNIKI